MPDRIDIDLPKRHRGLLIVGDVHGHAELMESMIALARERDLLFVSCGDLVDRGPDSVGCLMRMRKLVDRRKGIWIRGNHEDKLYRAIKGRPVKINAALAETLQQLRDGKEGRAARDWLLETYPSVPYVARFRKSIVVHGGFGLRMLDRDPLPQTLRVRALYGQPLRPGKSSCRTIRTYGWVKEVPGGLNVVVGHDPCCDDTLLERRNSRGGRAIHIDSAAGKGGPLSAIETDHKGIPKRGWQIDPGGRSPRKTLIEPFSPKRVRKDYACAAA